MNILIVEDDVSSANVLQKILKAEKYNVDVTNSYQDAKLAIENNVYTLILLDWHLGDGSGLHLLEEIRELDINTSVLMLTCENDINEKVNALDSGADDYICKPYSSVELLARIRAILRRESNKKVSTIIFENLELDTKTHEVKFDGNLINLTTTEYDLLKLFMQNQNVVLTRYQLNEHIMKDFASMGNSNIIDAHIKNLRKKLKNCDFIKTVRGVGYTLKK